MTNEEKAKEIADKYYKMFDDCTLATGVEKGAIEMAQWKDEQFLEEKKEIDEQWKRLMTESKSIGVSLLQHKEKQIIARAKTFLKEIARVCDITDENGYRVEEHYLLAELEKVMKGE